MLLLAVILFTLLAVAYLHLGISLAHAYMYAIPFSLKVLHSTNYAPHILSQYYKQLLD